MWEERVPGGKAERHPLKIELGVMLAVGWMGG